MKRLMPLILLFGAANALGQEWGEPPGDNMPFIYIRGGSWDGSSFNYQVIGHTTRARLDRVHFQTVGDGIADGDTGYGFFEFWGEYEPPWVIFDWPPL
jgi:hypothetical protein